jgi:hypothetical protein
MFARAAKAAPGLPPPPFELSEHGKNTFLGSIFDTFEIQRKLLPLLSLCSCTERFV